MDALYNDAALAAFYDWDNPWPADFDWFLTQLQGAASVLDLGCGTGIFSAALAARGADVVGVDPAAAMLTLARVRPGGDRVRWIRAGAQGLDLGRRFDAVVMTGHAFQTLLTAADRAACLATIARHLAPGGRFLFDSRNPEAREWERWTPEATLEMRAHPDFGQVKRWNTAVWNAADRDTARSNTATSNSATGIVTYETHYELADGRHFEARSKIAFPGFEALAREIAAAGLAVDRWYGDPAGGPIQTGCSDFIPVGRLAR